MWMDVFDGGEYFDSCVLFYVVYLVDIIKVFVF